MDNIEKMNSELGSSIKKEIAFLQEQKKDLNSEKEINSLKREIEELEKKYSLFFPKK